MHETIKKMSHIEHQAVIIFFTRKGEYSGEQSVKYKPDSIALETCVGSEESTKNDLS